jgi:hypothetical protein
MVRLRRRAAVAGKALVAALAAASIGASSIDAQAATPTFRSASHASTASSSQTLSIPTPSAVADGDVLVGALTVRVGSAASISPPAGWTLVLGTECTSTNNPLATAIFTKVAAAGEPAAHTFSISTATGAVGSILAYTGVDRNQPIDVSGGGINRSSRNIIAPSITTTVDGALLVGFFAESGRSSISTPSGMTSRGGASSGTAAPAARNLVADQLLAGAGATGDRTARTNSSTNCLVGQLVALRPGSDAPGSTSPPTITGSAIEGSELTATAGSWTGSPTGFGYQWQRSADGSSWGDIAGAQGSSYTLTDADVGLVVRVVVTASNAAGSTSAASAATGTVDPDTAPTNVEPPAVSGTAQEGQTLTATTGTWSDSPTGFGYQWQRSGDGQSWSDVGGAQGSGYTLADADVGSVVRVVVTASNAAGSTSAASAATGTVEPDTAPTNVEPPAVSGTAQEGQTLTATTGTWTDSPTGFAYQWQRSGDGQSWSDVGGAQDSGYTPSADDLGSLLRVTVSASNGGGTRTASSAATGAVLPAAPSNSSPPVVSGVAAEGERLDTSSGEWSGNPTYSYQWQTCNSALTTCTDVGRDEDNYTIKSDDVELVIRVTVTASNAGGSSAVTSEPTAVVAPLPPVNIAPPTISGVLEQGEAVRAAPGDWQSAGSLSYTYQWQRSTDGGLGWTDIVGATGSSYTLQADDVGLVLRVGVTASNVSGSASATSAATEVIRPPGLPTNTNPPMFSGYTQFDRTLTATTGSWSGSPTSYAYRWQRSTDSGLTWVDIASASSYRYRLTSADVGFRVRVRVTATNAFGSTAVASHEATVYPTGNFVVVINQTWSCGSTVNLDLVKVTITDANKNAIGLAGGCTGRIGSVEIDTWVTDGIRVTTSDPHDLVVEGGYIRCHDRSDNTHQDGIQVRGGQRVTFRNLLIDCGTANNGAIFITGDTTADIVCEQCFLKPGNSTLYISSGSGSGARNSTVCDGRAFGVRISEGAVNPVNENNTVLLLEDPLCEPTAWPAEEQYPWGGAAPPPPPPPG